MNIRENLEKNLEIIDDHFANVCIICKSDAMNLAIMELEEKWPNFDIEKWLFFFKISTGIDELYTITDMEIIKEMNKEFLFLYKEELKNLVE